MCLIKSLWGLCSLVFFPPMVLVRDYLSLLNEQSGRLTPIVYTLSVSDQAKTDEVEYGVKYPLPMMVSVIYTETKENSCTLFQGDFL